MAQVQGRAMNKLPTKPKDVKLYINEFLYIKNGTSMRFIPPLWLQEALTEFWQRGKIEGEKRIKSVLKDLVQ